MQYVVILTQVDMHLGQSEYVYIDYKINMFKEGLDVHEHNMTSTKFSQVRPIMNKKSHRKQSLNWIA